MVRRSVVKSGVLWATMAALALGGVASACRSEGEVFILAASQVGGATEGYGPYEIRVSLQGQREVKAGRLYWQTPAMSDPTVVGLEEVPGLALERVGWIRPEGEPLALGTQVRWWVEVDTADGTARSPVDAPREVWFFEVGPANQPVRLAEVSPERGLEEGGDRVFIRGQGFEPGSEVRFDGAPAPEATVVTAHLIEAVSPPGDGGWATVEVRSPRGAAGSRRDAFYYIPRPDVLAVVPGEGPAAGGTDVVIAGADFDDGAAVFFGGAQAPFSIALDRGTLLTRTPPGAPGPADVRVVNLDGQAGELAAGFTYIPAPELAGVTPAFGPDEGGTAVEITGAGFQEGVEVFFDDQAAAVVSVEPGLIRAVTPPHAPGRVDVNLFNPDRQRARLAEAYTYLPPPRLDRVQPQEGLTTGGEEVELLGAGFFEGMGVTFDGLACAEVVVVTSRLATCRTPAHPEGPVDVRVEVDGRSDTLEDAYTYILPPPEIVGIDPDRGTDLGGTVVEIEVSNLQPGARVFFDGAPVEVVAEDLARGVLTVITEPHPEGTVDVRVRNRDGRDAVAPGGFTFVGPPVIDAVEPPRGPDTGGNLVTIRGRNFLPGMTVLIGGVEAEVVAVDPASGTAQVRPPASPLGPGESERVVDVRVTNPDGRFDIAPDAYTYIVAPPQIDALEPARGPTWGGNTVVIRGSGFREGALVFVNGVPVPVVRVSGVELRLVMPPGEPGQAEVEVVNLDGQRDSAPYTYVDPTLRPSGGLTAGFTTVTIDGAGFEPGMRVRFGGVDAVEVTVESPDRLRAITPPGAVGQADLRLETPGGLGDTYAARFAYRVYADVTDDAGIQREPGCIELDAADLNGDGDADLVVANGGLFQDDTRFVANAVYLNQGATFERRELPRAENSMNVDLADIDADGDLDMMIINLDSDNRLYVNSGAGAFTEANDRLPFSTFSYDGGFIQANRDAAPDILFINTAEPENLFRNNGSGRFTDRSGDITQDFSEHDHDYSRGDLNGDGLEDFVVVVDNTVESNGRQRYAADHRLYLSNGDGTYRVTAEWPLGQMFADVLESQIGDVNGDGINDIVAVDNLDQSAPRTVPTTGVVRNSVMIFLGLGGGEFVYRPDLIRDDLVAPSFSFALTDLDGDGDLDLAVANFANVGDLSPFGSTGQPNYLFVNRGDGRFEDASASWPPGVDVTSDIAAGDFDGDGTADLALCNYLTPNRLLVQTASP